MKLLHWDPIVHIVSINIGGIVVTVVELLTSHSGPVWPLVSLRCHFVPSLMFTSAMSSVPNSLANWRYFIIKIGKHAQDKMQIHQPINNELKANLKIFIIMCQCWTRFSTTSSVLDTWYKRLRGTLYSVVRARTLSRNPSFFQIFYRHQALSFSSAFVWTLDSLENHDYETKKSRIWNCKTIFWAHRLCIVSLLPVGKNVWLPAVCTLLVWFPPLLRKLLYSEANKAGSHLLRYYATSKQAKQAKTWIVLSIV